MDWRNRIGLYGSYFFGVAAIGFTLPFLPLYLGQQGLSDRAIGLISTLAALAGLAQFPIGLWSDRLGHRKPFLVAALVLLAVATALLRGHHGPVALAILVVLFAENGLGRTIVESLSGAEAAALARPGEVGKALGALRFWKPIGIVVVTLAGGWIAERNGVAAVLGPLVVVQCLAVAAALLIHEVPGAKSDARRDLVEEAPAGDRPADGWLPRDRELWIFIAAMVLFHTANAPGGVYLGLLLKRDLHAPERMLAWAFAVSMAAWMLVVWPAGWLSDRVGRRPLLIFAWTVMALRLGVVALAGRPWQIVANQAFDGLANGLFAVVAAAWVTDRFDDPRRLGQAQVLVGTALVFGSALGPAISSVLVNPLGYRGLFAVLAAIGAAATALVVGFVPETLPNAAKHRADLEIEPTATAFSSELSNTP